MPRGKGNAEVTFRLPHATSQSAYERIGMDNLAAAVLTHADATAGLCCHRAVRFVRREARTVTDNKRRSAL